MMMMVRVSCHTHSHTHLPPYCTFQHASHLHSRADRCERIHLGEADCLTVDSWGLLDHDGGAGLALGSWGCGGVRWFGLMKEDRETLKFVY